MIVFKDLYHDEEWFLHLFRFNVIRHDRNQLIAISPSLLISCQLAVFTNI